MKRSVAVMVLIETNNPLLDPDQLDVSTAEKVARIRKAVIDELPNLNRVVMVLSEENARLMCAAHEAAARASGLDLIKRPPPDYVTPTRE